VKIDPEIVSISNNLATVFLIWRGMSYLFQYLMKRLDKVEVDVYGPSLSSYHALAAVGRSTQPQEESTT
jgi:hypothetical protein